MSLLPLPLLLKKWHRPGILLIGIVLIKNTSRYRTNVHSKTILLFKVLSSTKRLFITFWMKGNISINSFDPHVQCSCVEDDIQALISHSVLIPSIYSWAQGRSENKIRIKFHVPCNSLIITGSRKNSTHSHHSRYSVFQSDNAYMWQRGFAWKKIYFLIRLF